MVTSEERLKILKMIQEGKITPEDGIQLMEALDTAEKQAAAAVKKPPAPPAQPVTRGARWLRVRVTDTDSGKVRVNVRLPAGLVTAGLKMGAKFAPEVEGLDMSQLTEFINAGETGKLVDVYDDEDGEHVEVFVE